MAKGKIIFISGPSGAGKGTLVKLLAERHPEFVFPKSFTTRPPRPKESEGNPYHFISKKEFKKKIKNGDFLEYAIVHEKEFYGTEKNSLLLPLVEGKIVIKELDVQGYEEVKGKLNREDFLSLFINVKGGTKELISRILKRAPMSEEELNRRKKSIEKELKFQKKYDRTIINENREKMVEEVEKIIEKEIKK